MDGRIISKELLEKEKLVFESRQVSQKAYRLLPLEDGKVFDNRIIILLFKPHKACPEICSDFYPPDFWDFKMAVKGHWVLDELSGENYFIYCQPSTAEYYEQWLGKKFQRKGCVFCEKGEKASIRYVFEIFDYQKLIGEKDLGEGEERPQIQVLLGPRTIYNQLWNKFKVDNKFWDNKVVRITKDTKKGYRFAEYIVEVEGIEPVEINDERVKSYLFDENNWINPVTSGIIRLSHTIEEDNLKNGFVSTSSIDVNVVQGKGVDTQKDIRRKIKW